MQKITVETGPCACCGGETEYHHNQRDEDGQFYCQRCCAIAEAEEVYDSYVEGYFTYTEYLKMAAAARIFPRRRHPKAKPLVKRGD